MLSNTPIAIEAMTKKGPKTKTRPLREWLEVIDERASMLNYRMRKLVVKHGPPEFMGKEAKSKYVKYEQSLEKLRDMREQLREAVETELDELAQARKGEYSKELAARMVRKPAFSEEKLHGGDIIIRDAKGGTIVPLYRDPEGKLHTMAPVKRRTELEKEIDLNMLASAPTWYARTFGVMRDVFTETLVRPARNAYKKLYLFERAHEQRLYDVLKPVLNNPAALERVTLILEGEAPKGATAVEHEAAKSLREWYDKLFKEFGLDAERYLEEYAPRVREYGSFLEIVKQNPSAPKELQFFAELERTAPTEVFPRDLNALSSALTYLRLGARKKFLQPFLDEVAPLVQEMHPDRKRIWEDFVSVLLHRPVWEERLVNNMTDAIITAVVGELPKGTRQRYANQISTWITHLGYMGVIGGNIGSALKNLTQSALAVFSLSNNPVEGTIYFNKAIRALLSPEGRKAMRYCWVYDMRQFLEGVDRHIGLGKTSNFARALEKAGFFAFEWAEKYNVSTAYMMKLLQQLDNGVPLAEAVEAANTFAADTQFLYGIDSPLLTKSPLGRVLGMLYSWPINFMRLMHKFGMRHEYTKILNAFAGLTAVCWATEKITGLDFSSARPTNSIADWPLISYTLVGETSMPIETLQSVYNYLHTVLNSATSDNPREREEAYREMVRSLWNYVPFNVARGRVTTVAKAALHDWEVHGDEGELLYRFGEIDVPGEAEPRRLPPPAGLIPEQVRALLGTTVEQRERRRIQNEVGSQLARITALRDKAFRIYTGQEDGDIREVQQQIMALGGKPLTYGDVVEKMREQAQRGEETYVMRRTRPMVRRGGSVEEPSPAVGTLREIIGI